jgi:dipeptidase D
MAGGHSGGDIWRGRANAVKLVAELMTELGKTGRNVKLKSLIAGDGILNKIPNLFQAEIIVPTAGADPELASLIKSFLISRISQNPDDIHSAVITVEIVPAPEGTVGTSDFSQFLAGSITAAPNGVIDSDPRYSHSIYTSNNLSSLRIGPSIAGRLSAEFGFMARGYSEQRIANIANWLTDAFSNRNFVSNFRTEIKSSFPAWIEPETSSLMQEVLNHSGYFNQKYFLSAGLEPSAFKQKFPTLEVIAIGPMIQFAHSVSEKMKLDSIPRTLEGVKRIIQMQ